MSLPNKVYSIWGSEDDGFRFPITEQMFSSSQSAVTFLQYKNEKSPVGIEITDIDFSDVNLIGNLNPPPIGKVVRLFLYETSNEDGYIFFKDILDFYEGDVDSLYAFDWVFVMEHEVGE